MVIELIKNKKEYEEVLSEVRSAWDANKGSPLGDRLEILLHLIDVYERKRFKIERQNPIDVIKNRMDNLGLKQKDLLHVFGGKNRASEVLAGKVDLNLRMIRGLCEVLNLTYNSLIEPVKEILIDTPLGDWPRRKKAIVNIGDFE